MFLATMFLLLFLESGDPCTFFAQWEYTSILCNTSDNSLSEHEVGLCN